MKRSSSEVTVTIAPARWRLRCPRICRPLPEGVRPGDRHWWREYVALIEDGYIPHDAGGFYLRADYDDARRTMCDCGEDMDFRGFELVGPDGERVACRIYACARCAGPGSSSDQTSSELQDLADPIRARDYDSVVSVHARRR